MTDLNLMSDPTGPLNWSPADLPSLAGKVALVTGGNALDGIGGNITHQLALLGAKVYVGARSAARVEEGIKSILSASPSLSASNLVPFVADLGDWKAVKKEAEKLLKEESRLDILINNGGIMPPHLELNEFGVATNMAVNHVAHFILTTTLLPLLTKTALADAKNNVRIVNVASNAHRVAPPTSSFSTLASWNDDYGGSENPNAAWPRYGYTKTANILFSSELQRRLDKEGTPIIVTAPHPGAVRTEAAGRVLGYSELWKQGLTPYEGALTPLWCAVSREVGEQFKGKYVVPYGELEETSALAKNEEEARGLWKVSEEVLGAAGLM
jgi:NAD(P)-dependent dehydrogenase (short-subunit alcohol dehydrogenase family)